MDNSEEIEKVKDEIAKTKAQVEKFRELTKPISLEQVIGRVSQMDPNYNKSVNELALRQAEQKLEDLNLVIEKAGSKDFGTCLKCKKTIPVGRLMIRPES